MTHCAGQNGEKALSFDFSLSSEETELLEKEFGSVNIRQSV